MIQKKIDENEQRQKNAIEIKKQNKNTTNKNYYEWIDKNILSNPFKNYRKIIVNLILAPYLVVMKKMSFEDSYRIIKEWLQKCDFLRKLDFNTRSVVNPAFMTAYKKQIPSMSIRTLKTNYNGLYVLLEQKGERKERGEGGY
ncbi:MAG: hypothetical protein ACRD6U_05255 [Nitrososphaeraceae archaeon]